MALSDNSFLGDIEQRSKCPRCGASRKFFCYDCCLAMPCIEGRLPTVQLPFTIDIIKHEKEKNSKSTAFHGPLLAPNHVKMYKFPHVPDYSNTEEQVVLLFPESSAVKVSDLALDPHIPLRFVVLDCVWDNALAMRADPNIANLTSVKLAQHPTQYWRPQKNRPDTDLATIEALYYLAMEYRTEVMRVKYDGIYDNLLFFFDHFLTTIRGRGFEFQ